MTQAEVETVTIDARGMMCPRPIIELAKARRRVGVGALLEIRADDLAFESDVRAWCETTGNPLISLEKDGDLVAAKIRVEC